MHWSVDTGSRDLVELLLTHKADTEKSDFQGNTPLVKAAERKQAEVLALLLEIVEGLRQR